ncbi:PilZ domain-containing protein [Sphingorhabdus sp. SMR4y]|uniref:PilZ domain-containing protein n=1 Tax=Sphingorhabdus sp. SMR4y TaxID=2584094 RepID=UPI000B5CE5C4|nr:PilZ domain-containing protein [Sphingorhabdus sp. SMR4y]ASK87082.1 PilZ domain protein [Sphingorhabdus sp. SMR4y]
MTNMIESGTSSTPPTDNIVVDEDRRKQNRHIAMLRLAKIKAEAGEGWGFIKNLSATGMMVEVHPNFELGDTVSALLTEEQELSGTVRWRKEALAGVEFFSPIDVANVLTKPAETKRGRVPRLPRIEMKHPIDVFQGTRLIHGDICDISPAGICIRTEHVFEIGKDVRLSVPDLLDIIGTVRWQSGARVGIVFSRRLPLDDLMVWLSTFYQASRLDTGELSDLNEGSHAGGSDESAADRLPFQIIGHDDLGKEILIDTLHSATEALTQFKATSKFFYRVSIRNADGEELSIGTIVLRAFDEERAAAKS